MPLDRQNTQVGSECWTVACSCRAPAYRDFPAFCDLDFRRAEGRNSGSKARKDTQKHAGPRCGRITQQSIRGGKP